MKPREKKRRKTVSLNQKVRLSIGLSQVQMAALFGLKRASISMEESGKRNLPTAINRRISLIGHFLDQSIEIPMPQMTKMEVDNCVKTIDDLLEIHQNMAKLLNFQKIEMEDTLEKNKRLWYVLDNWETFMDPQMPLESDLDNRDALFSYEGPRNLQPMWKERLTLQLKINKNESIIKTLEEEKQKLIRLNPPSTI